MERLDVDVKKPLDVLSVVSVILLAPYSQLQSYSCIVNFVRKMKQAAGPLVIYHQKKSKNTKGSKVGRLYLPTLEIRVEQKRNRVEKERKRGEK